jgi:hypothetical protein
MQVLPRIPALTHPRKNAAWTPRPPEGDSAAVAVCGPHSLASGPAASGDEGVRLFNRPTIIVGS